MAPENPALPIPEEPIPIQVRTALPGEDIFERLAILLEAIPKRWESLPAPLVPVSGRSAEVVLKAASKEQIQEAVRWIIRLRSTSSAERAELIKTELRQRIPTEVDLWVPGYLPESQQMEGLGEVAITVEAWLQWAEALGRKDALLFAASSSVNVLKRRQNVQMILPIIHTWAELPPSPGAERSRALLQSSLADLLYRVGNSQKALEAYRTARQIFVAIGDRIGQGNTWRGEADALFLLGDNQKALEAYKTAREIFIAARSQLGQGSTWKGEADVLFFLGHNEKALGAYRTAREIFIAVDDQIGQGNTWKGEADVFYRFGDNQKALEAYRKGGQLFKAAGDQLGQGNTLKGEANILSRLSDNGKALEAYREARQLFISAGSQLGEGNTWNGEADVLFQLGNSEKALEAYGNAKRLFIDVNELLGQGNAWLGEANVLFRCGDIEKALEEYGIARQIFIAVGSQLGQGNTWKGEGDVLFHFGDNEKALEAYKTAREFFVTVGDQLGKGSTWRGEAVVFFRLEDKERALEAYRTARQIFDAVGNQLGQGNTWEGEADVLFHFGDKEKALEAYRTARAFFIAVGDQLGQGNAWLGEARSLRQNLDWRGAAEAATAAIRNYQRVEDVPDQISAFLLKAQAEDQTGDAVAAAQSATEAIRLHSQWRKTWITDLHRTDQEATISQAYDLLVPLRARQAGQTAEALRLAEEARSRVFLDLLATPPNRGENVPAVDLMAERQRLEADIWQVEEQLRSSPEPSRQEEVQAKRRQLDQELEWNHYQRLAVQPEPFVEAVPLDATAIQNLALETGPLLLYYVAEREVWGFLVLPESSEIVLQHIALSREELSQEVRALAHDLANPLYEPRAEARAHKLWNLLIAPFSERIPKDRPLVLVPHGPLHELPFEALLDPAGKPLFERWQISVTPSASALDFARRRHTKATENDSFLAFSSGKGLSLPVEEIAEISSFFGTNQAAFLPTEARYTNYEKLVTQTRHLLIATRGVHTEGSRTETYLEIQPTTEVHDSRLTASEIATIPLQAELVALAACDTSHGQALLSDERLDLTRSFLIARAAAVLATRWKVPEDIATSRFLADFYRAYRQGGPQGKGLRKDEALTVARRQARERGDHAQVWAAWVLVGDAR
jgi:CHAT domain-containing protein/tetratricopeptide (TPR) repeat protein